MQSSSELAIDVRGLRKSYTTKAGTKVAVDGIDLQIKAGEIFAILGPNGAGKTTTVEILEGYRDRDAGEVSVLGQDPGTLGRDNREWRNRIGIVLQSTNDVADLTVYESVSHFAKYYATPKDPESVIESVGLTEKRDAKVLSLSGGQRRRLDVALGIIGTPDILFLDEPTTGFDPEARRVFWDLIRSLRAAGTTIVLTTHYLDEAEALAERVAVITDGRIAEVATPQTLGGRHQALAVVSWVENGVTQRLESADPAAEVVKLSQRLGRVDELLVTRPSLEEIYLSMIGQPENGDAR
jgi:ABC-2 type transport system ATP-binding protein